MKLSNKQLTVRASNTGVSKVRAQLRPVKAKKIKENQAVKEFHLLARRGCSFKIMVFSPLKSYIPTIINLLHS